MRTEPIARGGSTDAAASAPGLARAVLFLGGSVLVHAVAALLFLGEPPAVRPVVIPPAAVEVEVGWRQGSGPPEAAGNVLPAPPSPRPLPPAALAELKRPSRRRAPLPVAPPSVEAPEQRMEPVTAEAGVASVAPLEAPSPPVAAEGSSEETRPEGGLTGSSATGGEGLGVAGGPSAPSEMEVPGEVHPADAMYLSAYGARLSSLVTRHRRYPANAVRLRMQGTVLVRVRIRGDGSLAAAPQLAMSSRYGALNAEALRMVEAAAPFAPLPGRHLPPFVEFFVPVRFSLRSSE